MATKPRYRADHVGSLLRPAELKAARSAHFDSKSISADELAAVEDTAIRRAVALQEEIGLRAVTDGEYRRAFWHYDFMDGLSGLDLVERGEGLKFSGATLKPLYPTITAPLDFPGDHPMLDHYRFLASAANGSTPKISIPGPSACHFRTAPADIAPPEYQDLDVLLGDIAAAYNKAVHAFYDAGCRYLQMDDIFFAYLGDEDQREQKRQQGFDPDELINAYARTIEAAIADRPDDMTIAMHLCRGNFQSTWMASGGYDPSAEQVLAETSVDVYFMEWDTERAGGLDPLRHLPKGDKRVLPGFITTKTAPLESLDDLERRFEQATKYVDIDQLGIAPQCGFASTEEGNVITVDDQKAKLELVVATAERIWGGV